MKVGGKIPTKKKQKDLVIRFLIKPKKTIFNQTFPPLGSLLQLIESRQC